ncbi:unnamed protein product, partial [marine sediment metagenome]
MDAEGNMHVVAGMTEEERRRFDEAIACELVELNETEYKRLLGVQKGSTS